MVDNFPIKQLCRYCGGDAQRLALCTGCEAALPWIAQACPGCALPQNHDGLCSRCLKKPPPFDSAWAAFRLEAPVQQGIHGLKYHAGFLQAGMLGRLMAEKLGRRAQPLPELLIPVPLHRTRLMRRGYNQALELARAFKRTLAITLDADAATRLRATPDQIGLTAAQRRRNLHGAFKVDASVADKHIALLDDVMTTGTTLAELARAARKAGAAKIEVWAAARATKAG
jgi:ComF family protein